ncbi:MAG: CDP-archaeol synthase [Candidatus Competibacter sp.]|nr:CDP-archaeol synthase [Candidatus Competibacter sp.]MDG4606616.1 CDP-archaeol synthase [Candidatus Contendobacter sp.]HRD50073.1 CDP-archaeol synthase [Candidatus Contendobacter sp.]
MLPIELKLLLLIIIANGAPVVAAAVCGAWGNHPVDGGRALADGRRWLGDSKTWRGVIAAALAAGLGAVLFGLSAWIGGVIGMAAMIGDLLSSFVKRRLGVPTSGMALGLDQIPEALLPLLAVAGEFALTWPAIGGTVAGFIVLELTLSPFFYWLGVRNRPY